jgi:hypothetical protein
MTQLTDDQKVQQEIDNYFKEHGQNDEHKDNVDKEVDQYFQEHHETSPEGSGNVYENSLLEPSADEIDQQKKDEKAPDYVAPVGGVIGGYAAYKGVGTKMLKPGEGVFKSAPINPITSTKPVTQEPNVRIEPNLNEPVSGLDHIETPKQNFELDPDFESKVDEVLQSQRGKNEPTGKQMRQGHNMEAQREKWALEENLGLHGTGAKHEIVKFGSAFPLESGLVTTEHTAREMEEEKARRAEAKARERAKQQVLREKAEENRKALEKQKQEALKQQALEREAAEEKAEQEAERVAQQKAEKETARRGLVKGVAKVATGALGGALAAPDFWDAYQEWKKNGMTDEAIIKMLQGFGGAAMAIPLPITEIGGMGLNLAAPYLVKQFGPHNKPRQAQ